MRKGEIFEAEDKNLHPHYFIFIEPIIDDRFKACILSSKPTNGNVLMKESHFCKLDHDDTPYKIQYLNSHLVVSDSFEKMNCWLKSNIPIGHLTEEGIGFVEENFRNKPRLLKAPIWKLRPNRI